MLMNHSLFFFAEYRARTQDDIIRHLENTIQDRKEGLIAKLPLGKYLPGEREGGTWIKIKPEYMDRLGHNFDLLIVGAQWGSGRRRKYLSHFILALLNKKESDIELSKWTTFAKLGSGYSDEELDQIQY